MDSKKYEQLINFIINEDEDKAKELFHEIVVEQSRGIYESIMAEEMMGVDEEDHTEEGIGGKVGDLLDEITAEEEGVSEGEEDEMEMDSEDSSGEESEEIFDLEADSEEDDSSEEVEDAVVRIEDKLDELMGEFEEILGKMDDDGEEKEKEEVEVDSEEEVEVDSEDEDMMQEAIQLQKVSAHHGDDGDQKESPVAANAGKEGMDSDPVDYSGGGDEKGRPAPQAKDVKDASSFKNAPAGKAKVDLSSAPKPVTKDGAQNDKSPYAK